MEENSTVTPATTSNRCVLSLRIVSLDYYMARPIRQVDACYSSFLGQPISEVPVVRIFGTTLAGQKMCLHLHKVFPYFYVPYEEDLPQDVKHALGFVRALATAIEKALKLANNIGAKRQHVYSCSLVRGKKFYGFHAAEQLFVKIVLYYPQEVTRLSGLLLGGGILNRRFQPYESHIPFLLQVMVDHNLAGMGHVHLSDVKFRQPVLVNQFIQICSSKPKLKSLVSSLVKYMASAESLAGGSEHLTSSFMELWCRKAEKGEESLSPLIDKQTTCELEGDTAVEAILNQCELSYTPLEKASSEVKMVQSLIPIWDELNVKGSMDAIGKQKRVLSPCHGETVTYENDFRKIFERFMEVPEESIINSGGEESSPANLHQDFDISEDDSTTKSKTLLLCTQAAHSKSSSLSKYLNEHESRSLSISSGEKDEKGVALLDEDFIRHQLTQSSQDTDEEAVELLKWLLSSQQDDVQTGYASDPEKVDDETSWSQVFQCADEALAKAISDYELCSQRECEAIIDCLEGADPNQVKGLAQESSNLRPNIFTGLTGAPRGSGTGHIAQLDGSCDEEMADQQLMKEKAEEDYTLSVDTREEFEAAPAQMSVNYTNPLLSWGKDQRKGWGPLSSKSSSHQFVANNEPKTVDGVIYSHKKDVVRALDKDCREESETNFELRDHSVRDLMRGKRIRRQQTHTSSMEGSTPVIATANADKSSTPINEVHVADGGKYGPLVSSPSDTRAKREEEMIMPRLPELGKNIQHLEKKTVLPGSSSKFGPLPFVKSSLSVGSTKAPASAKEDLELEGSSVPKEDGEIKELSPFSNRTLCSLQDPEMISCQGDIERDTCMSASQAWEKINTLVDAKEGLLAVSSLNFRPVCESHVNSCSRLSVKEFESELFVSVFCKKPPTIEHLLATFKSYSLPSADNGEVFYGKADDLPDQPAVMAGMLFKVRSKDVDHLPPYDFTRDVRWGRLTSIYSSANTWAPSAEDSSAVLPSHFHNDGSVLFLLSPVKLPPTGLKILKWLRLRQAFDDRDGQIEMFSEKEGNAVKANNVSQPSQEFRPPSPKYDETFLLPYSSDEGSRSMSSKHSAEPRLSGQKHSRSVSKIVTGTGNVLLQESRIRGEVSQISGPTAAENRFTPISQAGFRDPACTGHGQQLSVLSVEAFASTRGDLRPDPRYDSIKCIAMILHDDIIDNLLPTSRTIALLYSDQDDQSFRNLDALIDCEVIVMSDEASLLRMFVWFVRMYDPDMIVGWEIQGFSLGLLAERAANLGIGLLREISRLSASRIFPHTTENLAGKDTGPNLFGNAIKEGIAEPTIIDDEWGRTHGSGIHVGGRIVLNLWRIMRGELKLGIYTIEAVAEAVLQRKVPEIPWGTLTQWFASGSGRKRHLCINYYLARANLNLQIMNQLDLVNRTSELARVFGIDFFSVLSRGSQYRVESMMLRIAHSQNYLLISPSRQQVAAQPAMQCLPLVMEPESRLYTDPVVVLDFQSLYPSMMIAYNLCFSTCLGKVVPDNPKVLGVTSLNLDPRSLKDVKDCLTFTPNGIMFVSSKARPGVLPRLLDEILCTRIMVKRSMKNLLPSQKVLERVLNARQLALKLISNVTYGYTAAGFSGRMPCAELADSIVQSGRFTLERSINFVNSNTKWNARVVYGDTDSLFVLLKGRTRLEAFEIGEEIAGAITELNPHPVTLKMEKVYHPCVLLTKKRYVGYSYERPNQAAPKFDAKGIETVRRDSCAAVAKTLEKSLRVLFETHDISQVKAYLQRQWGKIMSCRVSFKDFIFAKEVRLGTYSTRASVLPPAAIVATKAMAVDPRAEPRYGERVPYVVIHGEPGARLVDMVVDPHVLVSTNSAYRLHDIYYITKQIIPALQRVFGLIGVDLRAWYNELPRMFRPPSTKRAGLAFPNLTKHLHDGSETDCGQTKSSSACTIDQFYLSQHCSVCGDLIQASCSVCDRCLASKEMVGMSLLGRSSCLERRFKHLLSICGHCSEVNEKEMEEGVGCTSLACSIFYERIKAQKELRAAVAASNLCGFLSLQ